jgi:hypothetical protein
MNNSLTIPGELIDSKERTASAPAFYLNLLKYNPLFRQPYAKPISHCHNDLRLLTNPNLSQTGWMKVNKNKENQSIDVRLLTTKKEKPRFLFLCQQSVVIDTMTFNFTLTITYTQTGARTVGLTHFYTVALGFFYSPFIVSLSFSEDCAAGVTPLHNAGCVTRATPHNLRSGKPPLHSVKQSIWFFYMHQINPLTLHGYFLYKIAFFVIG